jgi:glycosyltransferase involved in cell wall biosynthesis
MHPDGGILRSIRLPGETGKQTMPAEKSCLMAITGAFNVDGGMAVVNRLVIRALHERGYEVDVFALKETGGPECPLSAHCRRHYTFEDSKPAFVSSVYLAFAARRYSFAFVDLVNLAAAIAPVSTLGICRYLLWLHGREVFPPEPHLKGRIGLAHAWKLLASSEYTAQAVRSRFPELRIDTCDLALEPPDVPGSPAEPSRPIRLKAVEGMEHRLGQHVILCVGRMDSVEKYKGQDCLLRAFPAVYERYPEAQLVLAGNGNDFARLEAIAGSLAPPVRSRIFMPGYVDDESLQELYRSCYVFAMPSGNEGFGLVYLEAMNHAKPCLAARAAGSPGVVQNETTGVLVDYPASPSEVSSALCRLLGDPERARALGQAGWEAVRKRHLFQHFSERFWHALSNRETGNQGP